MTSNVYVGEQFLGWFLEEQREEVASMSSLLAVVDRAGTTNLLLVEDFLARKPGPAAEPSRPRAAGGRRSALGLAAIVGDDPDLLGPGIVGGWYSVENDIVLAPGTGGPPLRDPPPGRTASLLTLARAPS